MAKKNKPAIGHGPLRITIQGNIAAGKTHLAEWLADNLAALGHDVVFVEDDGLEGRWIDPKKPSGSVPDHPRRIVIKCKQANGDVGHLGEYELSYQLQAYRRKERET